jgi:hypothetical protein
MSDRPNVIGLDISKTRTGVCWGRIGETPRFASIVGNDMDNVAASYRLFRWLTEFTKVEHFDAAAIEAQISFGAFMGRYNEDKGKVEMTSNPQTTLAISKMVGAAEIVLHGRSIRTMSPAVSTVRKAFLGDGRLKSDLAKKAARLLCEHLGWSPANHDEADAGGVWFWTCIQVKPGLAHPITPMMQARAIGLAAPFRPKNEGK